MTLALIKKLNAGNYGHDWKAKVDKKAEFVTLKPCPNGIRISYQYQDGTFYVFDVYKAKVESEEMPTPEIEENLPVGPDQVNTIISSVINTLDPQLFYDALETQTAVSKFKISVGATSIIELKEVDDLWFNEKP